MKDGHAAIEESDDVVPRSEPAALPTSGVTAAALSIDAASSAVRAGPPAHGPDLTDEQLVLAVQRGDRQMGRLLYGRLVRVIDATLTRVIGPGQPEHDDLVQAVFEEVLRTLFKRQFAGRCRLTTWAASIACHVGLNAIRSRKTERGIFDRTVDLAESVNLSRGACIPEPALEARDELTRLRFTLATISPARAEAVLLHDGLGYDLGEVAALTQSTEAAVQSRLSRGRRDLVERLRLANRGGGASEDER
jgi:RNA polymerase sigma factor (sigma-70 family)